VMFARRTVLVGAGAAFLVSRKGLAMEEVEPENVYAIIGQMMAAPGKREELIAYLGEGSQDMPGNLAYQIWPTRATRTASGSPKSGVTKPRTRPASRCPKCRKLSARPARSSQGLGRGPRWRRFNAD